MKVPLLMKLAHCVSAARKCPMFLGLLLILGFVLNMTPARAEGSKDIVLAYPDGYRLFLDADPSKPQQFKVYAAEGEFINVGASHVGLGGQNQKGRIRLISPDGALVITYNDGNGPGIINNRTEEIGTSTLLGYTPGVYQVPAGQQGVWTVIFDFENAGYAVGFANLENGDDWNRVSNQPNNSQVLAWDITISSGAAGNMAGTTLHTGRVYTNEYVGIIRLNGFTTSANFYVLTDDGFIYRAEVKDIDPFRFPLSSNSVGLINAQRAPIYESRSRNESLRSADLTALDTLSFFTSFLYEPQAKDNGGIVNNKIFLNPPDTLALPTVATVTDVFRNDTHSTWLWGGIETLVLGSTYFAGFSQDSIPCNPGVIEFGKGGFFYFQRNTGGTITLELDLDNDGVFDTSGVDVVLNGILTDGLDSIFWDGLDGLGNPIAIQDSFTFTYSGIIRYGEFHIALSDVEEIKPTGGVTFNWTNAPPSYAGATDEFFYNHESIVNPLLPPILPTPVSGGMAGDEPAPTNIPYYYDSNPANPPGSGDNESNGNNNYLDQWAFIEVPLVTTPVVVNVVLNCVCSNNEPAITTTGDAFCEGDSLVLTATNSMNGIGDLTYTWSGPDNYAFSETIGETETSTAVVTTSSGSANNGLYTVTATTSNGCSDVDSIDVTVNATPNISTIVGGGGYCVGDDVVLVTANINAGLTTTTNYVWTGPGGFSETGSVVGIADIILTINDISMGQAGTYSISLSTAAGCDGGPFSTDIVVNPTPTLETNNPNVPVCENSNVQLCATNTTPGVGTMVCTWSGPNGFSSTETIGVNEDICLSLTNVGQSFDGTYTVVCTFNGCESAPLSFNLDVQPTPEINAISPTGNFCEGDTVTLTAQNVTPGIDTIIYVWVGPGVDDTLVVDTAAGNGVFEHTINGIQLAQAGIYTLTLYTTAGCAAVPQTTQFGVLAAPVVCNVTGGGDACVGQNVTLSAENCAENVLPVTYTWTGPNGNILATDASNGNGPYALSLLNVQVNNSGTYCITVTSQATGCTSETVCVDLSVSENPDLVVVATPDSSCVGGSIVLTGTAALGTGTITYTWTGPNGVVCTETVPATEPLTCTLTDVAPGDAGDYILVANSDQGCSLGPDTIQVVVFPDAEILTVEGAGTICDADTLFLNGTGTGTATSVDYEWVSPSGEVVGAGSTPTAGPFPGQDNTPETGIYTLTITTPDGCTDTEDVLVTVGCTPIAEIQFGDTTLCELDTLTLCGRNLNADCGIIDYTWLTPNGIPIVGSANGTDVFCDEILPLATYGSGYYYLFLNSNGCSSLADSVLITLNPNPVISGFSGGGTYCPGEIAQICFTQDNPAIGSFFYTCILPGGIQITDIGVTGETICIELTQSGFVFCSIESFDGCVSALGGTEVIFDSGFEVTATANSPVCSNQLLELNGFNSLPCSGDAEYTWIDPTGAVVFTGTAPCEGPFPASVSDPVAGEYCLIVNSPTSICADTACVNVEVLPVPEVIVGILGGGDVCENEDATLTAVVEKLGGGDIDFTWTLDGNPVANGTASSGDTLILDLPGVTMDDGGEYCLELTCPANGCTSETVCATVNVFKTPDILDITGAGTYCEGVNVMLDATGTPGPGQVTYTWTGPNFNFTGTAPCEGPFPATIPDIQQNQAGVYTLTLQLADCVFSQDITIFVNPTPDVTLTLDGPVCEGEETTLTATIDPDGAASVDWQISGPNGFNESGTVFSDTTIVFTVTVMDGDTYTISATSDQGCEADPAQVTASALEIPTPSLTASPNPLCPGDELQLVTQEQTGNDVSYCWFLDGTLLAITVEPVFNIMDPVSGSYTVQAKVDSCDNTSDPVTLSIVAAPTANDDEFTGPLGPISGNVLPNDVPSAGVTVTIVEGPNNGTVTINDDGSFTYTPNAGFAGPSDSFIYQICLESCPEECDQATVRITFNVQECEVPNVITPNGDGVNDVLRIDCVEFPPISTDNSLKIFNRWGDEIYQMDAYDNTWDGTHDGDEVPAGTYFYLFFPDRNDESEYLAGYIKVVR